MAERTAELEKKTRDLERFNRLFVDRELRMMELKNATQGPGRGAGGKENDNCQLLIVNCQSKKSLYRHSICVDKCTKQCNI